MAINLVEYDRAYRPSIMFEDHHRRIADILDKEEYLADLKKKAMLGIHSYKIIKEPTLHELLKDIKQRLKDDN